MFSRDLRTSPTVQKRAMKHIQAEKLEYKYCWWHSCVNARFSRTFQQRVRYTYREGPQLFCGAIGRVFAEVVRRGSGVVRS
jgi:hypothetical protein